MNVYLIVFLLFFAAICIWRMTMGFQNGFVSELSGLLSLAAALLCLYLLTMAGADLLNRHFTGLISGIIMLAIVLGLYKTFKLLFDALDLVSKLPIIRYLDQILGLVIGLVEAFIILYIAEIFLERYILS